MILAWHTGLRLSLSWLICSHRTLAGRLWPTGDVTGGRALAQEEALCGGGGVLPGSTQLQPLGSCHVNTSALVPPATRGGHFSLPST